jgi:hypothetical protein
MLVAVPQPTNVHNRRTTCPHRTTRPIGWAAEPRACGVPPLGGLGPRVDTTYWLTLSGGGTSAGMFEGLEDNAAFSSNFMLTSAAGALDT